MDTKTRPLSMLSTRDPPQNRGHIQTESEGLEKDFPCKQGQKESRSSHTYISIRNTREEKDLHKQTPNN